MKENILFLVPSLEQPRVVKRISEYSRKYKRVEAIGFVRSIHRVNNFNKLSDYPNVKVSVFGHLVDRKFFTRPYMYTRLLMHLMTKKTFWKSDVYVFGFDLRLAILISFHPSVWYEISDIFWLYKRKLIRILLQQLDYMLTKLSKSVVFTSKGYYDHYYSFLSPKKVEIRENKLLTYGRVSPISNILLDRIRIAFVGAFRYNQVIRDLISVVIKEENMELNFYGDGSPTALKIILKGAAEHPNIKYHGPFRNPEDLEAIYSMNNVNFVAYDNQLFNEKVLMPNKFYESGFFNIPIVCSSNTYVGDAVLKYGMGWVINPDEAGISSFIRVLNLPEIEKIHKGIKTLDKDLFVLD